MEPVESALVPRKDSNWKAMNVKVRIESLPILNQRLKLYGYDTLGQLVRDFLVGRFPPITEDKQIDAFSNNLQSNGTKTVTNSSFDPTFYKHIDLDDMLNYLIQIRRFENHNSRCLVSYFKRFGHVFFGPSPEDILKLTPHKRGWILQAMRAFSNYYNYKTNNPECKELIEKIINRFALNVGLDRHQRIYIVDDNYVASKIKELMSIQGEIGLTVKVGLFSGLREEEIIYLHKTEVCSNLSGCNCDNLHAINKPNGMTVVVVNWFRGHKKCYFTFLPTAIWNRFRQLDAFDSVNIEVAHKLTKKDSFLYPTSFKKTNASAETIL
jgi:intergrase/recombinase